MVGEDDAVEVVELVLHDACQVAFHPFVVLLELFVLVGDADACGALHLLVNAGQTEAAFLRDVGLRLVVLLDVGVDEGADVAFVLGQVFADDVEVDDGEPDGEAHLGCCQSDAFAVLQRLVHVLNELLQVGVVGAYFLGLLPEYRLAVCVDG